MRIKKIIVVYLIGFIFLISVLMFSIDNTNTSHFPIEQNNPNTSQVDYNNEALTAYQNFTMIETAENNGTMTNISSIDLDLDTSRWNVTNIEFNITDMDFENETKTIEDKSTGYIKIDKFDYNCLGVEVEILASTTVYGLYIYGENGTLYPTIKEIYVQIQGIEAGSRKPNGTIIASTLLNMSKSLGETWHLQTFPTPVPLSKGIYYLIINGTSIGLTQGYVYDWHLCDTNPNYPHLNISKYAKPPGSSWGEPEPGRPFLHKLIQKINEDFYPEEINMTAEIDGIDHHFNNGNVISTGNLSLNFNNYHPNTKILQIPIKNNLSDALILNLSYYIKLNNSLSFSGSVKIRENLDNLWILEPNLNRFGYNYSIRYEYPTHWKYVSAWKNDINITNPPDVLKVGNSISILNDTITKGADWKITANSTRIDTTIDPGGKTSYTVGEEIKFWVRSLPNVGNYTCVLTDSIGDVAYSKLVEKDNTADFEYNYTLPANARSGEWTAHVFWNNETDAGGQTQAYQISGGGTSPGTTVIGGDSDGGSDSSTTTDYFLVLVAIIIVSLIAIGSITSYTAYKRVMKTRERHREMLHDKFTDILSLNHVIVIDKKSGLNVFEQFFGGKSMDATLISGFLDAIRSFGLELTGSYRQTQTIVLEYQNSKVLMSEFKNFRLILIMAEKPSQVFLNSINSLSQNIDEQFGEELKKFAGNIKAFEGIKDLIDKHLNIAFISPLKVEISPNIKLKPAERSMITKAKQLMKQNNLTYFYSTFLMSDQAFNQRDTQVIFNLIEKGIFLPTDISLS